MKFILLHSHKVGVKVLQLDQKRTSPQNEEARHIVIFALKGPTAEILSMEKTLKTGEFLTLDLKP